MMMVMAHSAKIGYGFHLTPGREWRVLTVLVWIGGIMHERRKEEIHGGIYRVKKAVHTY